MLVVKPWSRDFFPTLEIFNKIQIWIRHPYVPLHLWFDTLLEIMRKALRNFLMVGELAEMDIPEGLLEIIMLECLGGS